MEVHQRFHWLSLKSLMSILLGRWLLNGKNMANSFYQYLCRCGQLARLMTIQKHHLRVYVFDRKGCRLWFLHWIRSSIFCLITWRIRCVELCRMILCFEYWCLCVKVWCCIGIETPKLMWNVKQKKMNLVHVLQNVSLVQFRLVPRFPLDRLEGYRL